MASIDDIMNAISGYSDIQGDEKRKQAYEYLKDLENIGYTPEMLGDTEINKIDPETRNAQIQALRSLQNLYAKGGMDEASKLATLEAQNRANQENRSNQMAIQANMAQRGIGGSGLEYANALLGSQQSAQTRALAGTQIANDARTRALNALAQSAQMGSNIRGQDTAAASAQDAINRFNAAQKTSAAEAAARNKSDIGKMRYQSLYNEGTENYNKGEEGRKAIGSGISGIAGMVASAYGGPAAGAAVNKVGNTITSMSERPKKNWWENEDNYA